MRYQGVWPVQDRDFVNVTVLEEQENAIYLASMSSAYPYPQVNQVTRAVCHIAGYILQKIDESTTMFIYMSDVDVLGSVPQMLKNKLA